MRKFVAIALVLILALSFAMPAFASIGGYGPGTVDSGDSAPGSYSRDTNRSTAYVPPGVTTIGDGQVALAQLPNANLNPGTGC